MSDSAIMRSLTIALIIVAIIIACNGGRLAMAQADTYSAEDTLDALNRASADTDVPLYTLYAIVKCETGGTFNPNLDGDGGHSHGPAQLNDYGNALPAFYAAGYTNPYDPYEAIYFMAESLRGDHRPLGRHTWNC